jgi:hypothetical protein
MASDKRSGASSWLPWIVLGTIALGGVGGALYFVFAEEGAHHACEQVVQVHAPRVREIVDEDLARGLVGVQSAADLVARGFLVPDRAQRMTEMRWAIQHRIREPPRGIPELMISPISFVAAIEPDGHVLVRDIEPDPMAGFDAGGTFPHVHAALTEGVASYALVEFPGLLPTDTPSQTVIYVAPSRHDGQIVGAIMAGTPLWRTAQRVTRQMQAEGLSTEGAILWVYLYRGETLHHHGTPADLDTIVPDFATRSAGLAESPGGFCHEVQQFGRWYCYGVIRLPQLGDDVGAVIYRSDPPD